MNTRQLNNLYFVVIIFIAGFLRFFKLGNRPFDGDEGIIAKMIENNSFFQAISNISKDVHPPLFHLLTKVWTDLFKINEFNLRIISAISAILLIIFIYYFCNKFINEKIAIIAIFFASISSYLIYYSQEARMYSLFSLCAFGTFYFLLKIIKEKNWSNWLFYGLFALALIYTQYLGFIVIFSQIIYLLIFSRKIFRKIYFWLTSLLIILFYSPQIATFINQLKARTSEQTQTGGLLENIKGIFGAFYRFSAGRIFLDINPESIMQLVSKPWGLLAFILSVVIPLILFVSGIKYFYTKNKSIFYYFVIPLIVGIIVALFSKEIGSRSTRYLIYLYPFYIIFVAQGAINFWIGWKKIIPILFVLIAFCGLFVYYDRDVKAPGTNEIAKYISGNIADNNVILIRGGFGGGEKWILNYYLNKQQSADNNRQITIIDLFENYNLGNLAELKSIKPENKIQELLNNYNKIYFYDMTYETDQISNADSNILGYDKENKPLTIWEINNKTN